MRLLAIAGIFVLMFTWAACGSIPAEEAAETESTITEPVVTLPSDELFEEWQLPSFGPYSIGMELPDENPIDTACRKEIEKIIQNTQEVAEMYSSFTELWKTETNHALMILRSKLTGNHLNELNEAQKAWEIYVKNDSALGSDLRAAVAEERWEHGYGVYSLTKSLRVQRYRALQLIEYCYAVTGEYEYIYQQ